MNSKEKMSTSFEFDENQIAADIDDILRRKPYEGITSHLRQMNMQDRLGSSRASSRQANENDFEVDEDGEGEDGEYAPRRSMPMPHPNQDQSISRLPLSSAAAAGGGGGGGASARAKGRLSASTTTKQRSSRLQSRNDDKSPRGQITSPGQAAEVGEEELIDNIANNIAPETQQRLLQAKVKVLLRQVEDNESIRGHLQLQNNDLNRQLRDEREENKKLKKRWTKKNKYKEQ